MSGLAELIVSVGADIRDFSRKMSTVSKEVSSVGKDLNDSIGNVGNSASQSAGLIATSFKGIGGVIAGAFAVGGVVNFSKNVIQTTADIQALESQYAQVMGKMKGNTDKYLDEMGAKWNKHPNELKSAYTQYVAILKGKGVAEQDAHKLAKDMLDRTVDANAFANEDMAATTDRFMAMVKGEYDSLDTAMVNLSATMLNDKAQEVYGKKFEDLSVTQQEQLKIQEAIRQHTSAGVFGQGVREADSYNNNVANLKNTWGELMATMGSPIIPIVNDALSGMTSILKSIDFGTIKEGFTGLFSKFTEGSTVVQKWSQMFQTIKPLVQEAISTVVTFVQEKLEVLKTFWDQNGSQILQAVSNVWKGIQAVFEFVFPVILAVVKHVWNSIKGVIDGALNIVMGLVKTFSGLLTGDFKGMWEGIKQLFKGAIQFVWNLMNLSFVGGLKKLAVSLIKSLVKSMKGLWDDIALKFMYGKDKVVELVTAMKSKGVSIFESIKTGIGNIVSGLWNTINNIFNTMKSGVTSIFYGIKSVASSVWNGINSSIQTVVNGIKSTVSSVWEGIKSTTSSVFNGIKSTATSVWNGIKDAITKPIETAKDTVLKIIDTIKDAFANMKITIPKPKLPSVSVNMKKNSMGIPYPDFNVSWNAKGGIFNGASILGGGQGVGEKGAEAVLPIQHKRYMRPFARAVAQHMDSMKGNTPQGDNITICLEYHGVSKREEVAGMIEEIDRQLGARWRRASRMGISSI
jgi:hypothetical protein